MQSDFPKNIMHNQEYRARRRFNLLDYDSCGDQAGSEAKPGVGTRCSLRPETSIVNSVDPLLPPGSRKNIRTLPCRANVGPSYGKPAVRTRSPDPPGWLMA